MAGILRTWQCLNDRCGSSFDSWEANPTCGACGCVRVAWQPAGGHVSRAAGSADADLRALADTFGLTNMNSAQRDRGAKMVKTQTAAPVNAPPVQFANGFSVPASAVGTAQCLPSSSPVSFKVTAGAGSALPRNQAVPGIKSNTRIEGSHKGAA